MKKVISLLMVLSMMLCMSVTVLANDSKVTTSGGSSTTIATYSKDASYTVTIPSAITVVANDGSPTAETLTIGAVVAKPGQELKVTVSSKNNWEVKNTNNGVTEGYGYDLYAGDATTTEKIASVNAGETEETTVSLTAKLKSGVTATTAGDYTDTLTFTVTVADKAS
jgi:hypothetical protein